MVRRYVCQSTQIFQMDEPDCPDHLCIRCCVPTDVRMLQWKSGGFADKVVGQVGYERKAERGHDCRVLGDGLLGRGLVCTYERTGRNAIDMSSLNVPRSYKSRRTSEMQ
jgi:hypothetical protein